ncbi:OST6 [Candida margitis]|uniref:OST6 n=1 Tax=Candida margitis TaxID=1775924 RepID=UPI0022279113|nr:OST6 [Candida margitis]KAI5961128.1 OST6 [Candida margitis]
MRRSLLPPLWIVLSFTLLLLVLPQLTLAEDHDDINQDAPSPQDSLIIDIHNGDLSQLQGHRDYYSILLFTSSNPAHECGPCQQVMPMVEQIGNLYLARYATSNLQIKFFNIDLGDITNAVIFRKLKMDTIPHVWLIPPRSSSGNDEVRLSNEDGSVEGIFESPHLEYPLKKASLEIQIVEFAKFLSEVLMVDLRVDTTTGQNGASQSSTITFLKTFIITFTIVVLIKKKGSGFISNTSRTTIMSYFAIGIVLLCVGGSQFAIQNQSPFVTKDDATGTLVFISGGMHYQYAVEIFIVGANYALLAASVVSLIKLGSYQVTESSLIKDENLRVWLIILISVVIYYLYSCLTSIVLRKDPGYPYPLTKLF